MDRRVKLEGRPMQGVDKSQYLISYHDSIPLRPSAFGIEPLKRSPLEHPLNCCVSFQET